MTSLSYEQVLLPLTLAALHLQ